jgi:hypothetical protein
MDTSWIDLYWDMAHLERLCVKSQPLDSLDSLWHESFRAAAKDLSRTLRNSTVRFGEPEGVVRVLEPELSLGQLEL